MKVFCFDYSHKWVELGVVVGTRSRDIPESKAMEYVQGNLVYLKSKDYL